MLRDFVSKYLEKILLHQIQPNGATLYKGRKIDSVSGRFFTCSFYDAKNMHLRLYRFWPRHPCKSDLLPKPDPIQDPALQHREMSKEEPAPREKNIQGWQ